MQKVKEEIKQSVITKINDIKPTQYFRTFAALFSTSKI